MNWRERNSEVGTNARSQNRERTKNETFWKGGTQNEKRSTKITKFYWNSKNPNENKLIFIAFFLFFVELWLLPRFVRPFLTVSAFFKAVKRSSSIFYFNFTMYATMTWIVAAKSTNTNNANNENNAIFQKVERSTNVNANNGVILRYPAFAFPPLD